MKMRLFSGLFGVLTFLTFSGCERVVDEPKSKLIVEYPSYQSKMGALSSSPPRNIFLVLSNPDSSNPRQIDIDPSSSSIEVEVVKGLTQVLQVLAVYPGPFDSSEVFHGSVQFTADRDEILISLNLQNLGPVVSGQLAGRVVSPLNNLTGVISAQLQIRPDLAPIEVQRDLIIGGWFHSIGIMMAGTNSSTTPLGITYQVLTPNGPISLFGTPKQLDEFSPSSRVSQVFVPRHQIEHFNGLQPEEPKAYILGFWHLDNNTNLSSHTVYNEVAGTSAPLPSMIKPLHANASTGVPETSELDFTYAENTTTTREELINSLLNLSNISTSGFITGSQQLLYAGNPSNLPCTDANKFNNCLELRKDHWDADGGLSRVGDFRGAFRFKRASSSSSCPIDNPVCSGFILPNESSLSLLPGVTVLSVRLFYLPNSSLSQGFDNHTLNKMSCVGSSLGLRGFIELPGAQINGSEIIVPKTNLVPNAAILAICGNFNDRELLMPIFMSREELGLAPLTN